MAVRDMKVNLFLFCFIQLLLQALCACPVWAVLLLELVVINYSVNVSRPCLCRWFLGTNL